MEASALESTVQVICELVTMQAPKWSPAGCPPTRCFTSLGFGFLMCHGIPCKPKEIEERNKNFLKAKQKDRSKCVTETCRRQ